MVQWTLAEFIKSNASKIQYVYKIIVQFLATCCVQDKQKSKQYLQDVFVKTTVPYYKKKLQQFILFN